MEIVKLTEFDILRVVLPGDYGYCSEYYYDVIGSESESGYRFELILKKRSEPYRKIWKEDESTLNLYGKMIEEGISLSALVDNEPAGVLIAEKRDWNNSVWIEKLHVAEDYKHKGIGTLIVKEFARLAGTKGYRVIYLETQNTNYPAIQFYMKNGFDLTGLDMKLYDGEENMNEVAVYMTKDLTPSG
jgi:ribosomal protein S18 acetylase RimI-like enzyme